VQGTPFSVENSSADLLRFPPWAGDPGQRHRSIPFHHKSFSRSSATLACALGVIGILLHSLVDYNLQIPANAAIFIRILLRILQQCGRTSDGDAFT
jgi:hypothetical protein